LQESAGLLTTLSLALAALFGFSVGKTFDVDNWQLYVSIILTIAFAVCLTFVSVYAYGVYRAIAVQTDRGVFFAENIESLLTIETRWTFVCAGLTIITFCWRCTKVS
jgi:hypothetical protein